jgi:hypothetical protein
MMRKLFLCTALAAGSALELLASQAAEPTERERIEVEGGPDSAAAPPAAGRPTPRPTGPAGIGVDLLLVPDSTADRVMAFDPITGNLVNADFIPPDPTNLSTPKSAIAHSSNASILVADQIDDVVQQYAADGTYIGIFAPAGGPNPAILDNILGIAYRPNGDLEVPVDSGTNQDSVAGFDGTGTYVGNFIANAAGGLDGPFDVYFRASDVLVSSINTDQILRYDLSGAFLGVFTAINDFPEQIAEASNSNVLVANFSGTEEGVVEYTAAGAFVGRYDPTGLTGYRGVYELPNGNILTTTGTGVHEISRAGALVETKISVTGAQYIELVQDLVTVRVLTAGPATGSNPASEVRRFQRTSP